MSDAPDPSEPDLENAPPLPPPVRVDGYVFVVTYGRSGSTLIQSLLNTCPGYCIRGENADALGPIAKSWAHVKDNANLANLARNQTVTAPDHPWFGGQSISPRRFGHALARAFVREVLRPPPGTRVLGFKEIRWGAQPGSVATSLRFLRTFFRNPKFIFNTRDHDQVARSAWWAAEPEDEVRARLVAWEEDYAAFLAAHPDLGLRVHYNDYVADHDALRPMFDFLGEGFDADTVARVMARPLTHAKDD